MKILVVGGTGYVGGYTSLFLKSKGYDVTIMSRSKPKGTSKLNDLPFVQGNYVEDDFTDGRLEGYDGLMFCAGIDLMYYPKDGSVGKAEFFEKCNTIGIPKFFEAAKREGISRSVYMSSFYPMVNPDSTDPYVRSRLLADKGARALSSSSFNVCSLGLPWIVGYFPGFNVVHWTAFAKYAMGQIPGFAEFAPAGGANYLTCQSVAEAMEGGLLRGESGKDYLLGDVNMSWKEFFEAWFNAAGRPRNLEVRPGEHPLIPTEVLNYLDGIVPNYDPSAEETRLLGYQRGVLRPMIEESFQYYSKQSL